MPARRRTVELVRATALSPSVRSLVFRFVDGEPFAFEAGQYVDLYAKTESGFVFTRPYSIASAPSAAPEIELAVTRVEGGPLSTALHAMPVGARAEVEGPSGNFTRRGADDERALFIATGTGLAPLRAMIAVDLTRPRGPALELLFGCRTEQDILWGDELRAWAASAGRFRLDVTLSRPSATWRGRSGYVQVHTKEIVEKLLPAHVYVCGLSPMVDAVVLLLARDLGLDRSRVHYETYD